ncbi:MAG TPA: site-specific integrase [Acidobacteriota bacterium]
MRKHSPEYYALFLCAIHTGMRSGELAGLQWGDIDFHGKFLTVRRHVNHGRVSRTKTDKNRRIDLSDALLSALQERRRVLRADWLKEGSKIPEWVFCNNDGKSPDMQNVKRRHFHKCLEKAELRRIRFHDLRHTFASLLIQAGEPLAYIKDQLGHASIKMTVDVYGHLVPGANRQAVNRLPTEATPPVAEPKAGDDVKAG